MLSGFLRNRKMQKLLGRRPDEFEKAFLCELGELGIPVPADEGPATAAG